MSRRGMWGRRRGRWWMLGRHESWRTLIVAWLRLSHAAEKFPANVERSAVEAGEFSGAGPAWRWFRSC